MSKSDEPATPPPFLPELWGADPAAEYESADDLIDAVKCTAAATGWPMPDIDSIREWWEEQNEQVG